MAIAQRGDNVRASWWRSCSACSRPTAAPGIASRRSHTLEAFLIEESYEVLEALDAGDVAEPLRGARRSPVPDRLSGRAARAPRARSASTTWCARISEQDGPPPPARLRRRQGARRRPRCSPTGARSRRPSTPRRASARRTLDGVPLELPALLRAQRLGEKAAAVGFDWPDVAGVREKIDEELREIDEAVARGRSARRSSTRSAICCSR